MILEFSQDFNKRQKIWIKKFECQQNTRILMGTESRQFRWKRIKAVWHESLAYLKGSRCPTHSKKLLRRGGITFTKTHGVKPK